MTDQSSSCLKQTKAKKFQAIQYITIATLVWSLLPLAIELSGVGGTPFVFFTIYGFTMAIGLAFYLMFWQSTDVKASVVEVWKARKGDKNSNWWDKYAFWLTVIGRFGIPIYAWSTQFIDTAVAAVLIESWALWYLLLDLINNKNKTTYKEKEYFTSTTIKITLFILCLFGLSFVNFSRDAEINSFANLGILLAIIAAFLSALNIDRSIKVGNEVKKFYESNTQTGNDNSELIYSITSVAISSFVVGVAGIAILFFQNIFGNSQVLDFSFSQFFWVIAIGAIVNPIAIIYTRKANIARENQYVEINAITYAAPLLSLVLLLLFTTVEINRFDFYLIGTTIVIVSNILLNIENRETGWGLKGLVVSLWLSGTFIHIRDGLWRGALGNIFTDNWLWSGSTDYFALLGLSATIFILVLSFRRLRILELTRKEEEVALDIFWKIGLLKNYTTLQLNAFLENLKTEKDDNMKANGIKMTDSEQLECIVKIDQSSPGEDLKKEKTKLENSINALSFNVTSFEKAEILKQIDLLVYSKSQGRDILEPLILVAFSLLTISISIGTRPYFEDWNGYMIDVFSILFVSTIAFLTINLFDLRKERSASVFKYNNVIANKWTNTQIPILLCLFIFITFLILLYGKWFSDWSWASEVTPTLRIT